jgi:hypothetical protein
MEEKKKPQTFEEKALSHIPKELLASMTHQTGVQGMDGLSPLEAIMREKGKTFQAPDVIPTAQGNAQSQQKQFTPMAIDGHVINVPADKFEAGVTMLTYIFAKLANKDKKVAKILDQFHFSMYDVNGQPIYVPSKKAKK